MKQIYINIVDMYVYSIRYVDATREESASLKVDLTNAVTKVVLVFCSEINGFNTCLFVHGTQ